MEELAKNFRKFKWFFTASDKLVIGGKNAEQNDYLLQKIKESKKEYVIMHTSSPGSPFSLILADKSTITKKDLQESAIFTASFSQAWKEKKKSEQVDIFSSFDIEKTKVMKAGNWRVNGKVQKINVPLILVLVRQKGILRAVPAQSAKNKKEIILEIAPGNIDKSAFVAKLALESSEKFSQDEILSAIPAGGLRIMKK